MRELTKIISCLVLILATSITFLSCSDDNEAKREGQTVINGNVTIEGSSTKGLAGEKSSGSGVAIEREGIQGSTILALLMSLVSLTKPANAQSGEDILVVAFQDGTEADRDTADDQGNFQVAVPRGDDVTLRFEASTFTVTTLITVTPDSDVTLNVALLPLLDPPEVQINAFEIVSGPIRTKELEGFIFDEEDANLTIRGGDDCIKATGSSEVDIKVHDLTITDCDNGIVGEDFANVILEAVAVPTLSIDANDDGIRAKDDSSIRLTGVDVFITGGTNGILATGTSGVQVDPSGNCTIRGGDEAVGERDSASVNTSSCVLSRATPAPTP